MAVRTRAVLIPRQVLFGNPQKTSPSISPDARRLAYVAPLDGVLNVWVGDRTGAGFRPVTTSANRPITNYSWAHDGRHLLYLQDSDGDENHHLYAVDLGTLEVRDLTPLAGVQAHLVAASHERPGEVLVALNARDPSWHDVHRVELASGTPELVEENPGFASWLIDRHHRVRGGTRVLDDSGWELLVRDSANGSWRTAFSATGDEAMNSSVVGFAEDDNEIHLLTSRNSDTNRLVRLDLATGAAVELAHDPGYDLAEVHTHPTTRALQLVVAVRARREIVHADPGLGADLEHLQTIDGGDLAILSRDLEDRTWVVGFHGDRRPAAYHVFDRATRELQFLFEDNPALHDYDLAHMEPFSFAARDGLRVHGYLTSPPDLARERLPAVVLVHGGPWGRNGWGFDGHAQLLANRGYLVVQVNFRGSTGYGRAFVNAGDREWGGRMHDDLLDAVDFLVARGEVDRDRVAICGGSYGGYAALAGVTFTPDVFCCAIAERGPVNLLTLLDNVPPYWESMRAMFARRIGDPAAGRDLLWERSPLRRIDAIEVPVLLSYGAHDPRVTAAEAAQVEQALQRNGVEYELIMFEDEGHGLSRPENRLRMFAATERFLARHLGGRSQDDQTRERADA